MAIPSGASILKHPQWVFFVRIAQAAVALVILALTCYGATIYSFDGDSLMLFTALSTLLMITYAFGSEHFFPPAYNFWAILGLECFAVIFWLVSFALLASEVSGFGTWSNWNHICFDNCYPKRYMFPRLSKRSLMNDLYNTIAAAAGLGGLEFVLFVTTVVVVSMSIHRERVGGAGAESGDPTSASATQSAAPQLTTRPRDLEQEMIDIENQHQNHSNIQHPQQYPTQADDVSQVERLE